MLRCNVGHRTALAREAPGAEVAADVVKARAAGHARVVLEVVAESVGLRCAPVLGPEVREPGTAGDQARQHAAGVGLREGRCPFGHQVLVLRAEHHRIGLLEGCGAAIDEGVVIKMILGQPRMQPENRE